MLLGIRTGVEQQIMTGNADVDGASANVDSDIERTQVEQLHVIVGILHNQLTRIAPQAIAGLGQHVPCRFGQHALVGHGDSQHFPSQKGHASYGTAKNSQILVDVFECDASVDHHDLQMVDELAHLFRSTIGAFVLSCDPGFARLFDNLLADEMRALAQFVNSQRANLLGCGLLAQFSKEGFKSLHYSYLSSKYW